MSRRGGPWAFAGLLATLLLALASLAAAGAGLRASASSPGPRLAFGDTVLWEVAPLRPGAWRLLAVALVAGAALAGWACVWLARLRSRRVVRTYRGSRDRLAYLLWTAWAALFAGLSVKLGGPLGLALGAFTAYVTAMNLDWLPRLVVTEDAWLGPTFGRVRVADVEAAELFDYPEERLVCLRLKLARGPMELWLSPRDKDALERLLASAKVSRKPGATGPKPRPPRV